MGNYFDPEERIDWELQKEQQRQKNIARNASKKPKRSGCRLPSDYLTNKQKQDLNGEVKIMNMNAPVAYKAFRMWPKDIQEQYLKGLVEKFHVSQKQVAEMMGTSLTSLSRYFSDKKLTNIFPKTRGRVCDVAGWEAFCQNASVSLEKPAGETNSVSEGSEPVSENASESLEKAVEETNSKLTPEEVLEHFKAGAISYNDAADLIGYKEDIPVVEPNEESAPTAKIKRHSGRYPWGEGCEEKTPEEWIAKIRDLKENGKSDKEIADILGMKKLEFQNLMRIAYKERKEREKQYDLNIASLVLQINDLQDWQELFRMLQAMKLPEKNFVYVELKEVIPRTDFTRYVRRPWNPHDTVETDEE